MHAKPMIIHPIYGANMLSEYEFDNNVISNRYLNVMRNKYIDIINREIC